MCLLRLWNQAGRHHLHFLSHTSFHAALAFCYNSLQKLSFPKMTPPRGRSCSLTLRPNCLHLAVYMVSDSCWALLCSPPKCEISSGTPVSLLWCFGVPWHTVWEPPSRTGVGGRNLELELAQGYRVALRIQTVLSLLPQPLNSAISRWVMVVGLLLSPSLSEFWWYRVVFMGWKTWVLE